jgi:alpha-ketoglutarate-dependent taurine dioxygenase
MRPDVVVVGGGFAARVHGVDASQPLPANDVEWLVGLLHTHKVLVLSGQNIDGFTPTALERFSNHFGAPTPHPSRATRLPGCDAIQVLTNVEKQELSEEAKNEPAIPGMHSASRVGRHVGQQLPAGDFHSDGDYETEPPSVTLLLCLAAPTIGGRTTFVDMEQAANRLQGADRSFAESLTIVREPNSPNGGWARSARNTAPLIRPHPYVPGRRALQLSHLETEWIDVRICEGDDVDNALANDALHKRVVHLRDKTLQDIMRPNSPAVYEHQYSPGDLVLWCNYSVMHQAPAQDVVASIHDAQSRHMWRISAKGPPCLRLPRLDEDAWVTEHITEQYRSRM